MPIGDLPGSLCCCWRGSTAQAKGGVYFAAVLGRPYGPSEVCEPECRYPDDFELVISPAGTARGGIGRVIVIDLHGLTSWSFLQTYILADRGYCIFDQRPHATLPSNTQHHLPCPRPASALAPKRPLPTLAQPACTFRTLVKNRFQQSRRPKSHQDMLLDGQVCCYDLLCLYFNPVASKQSSLLVWHRKSIIISKKMFLLASCYY